MVMFNEFKSPSIITGTHIQHNTKAPTLTNLSKTGTRKCTSAKHWAKIV